MAGARTMRMLSWICTVATLASACTDAGDPQLQLEPQLRDSLGIEIAESDGRLARARSTISVDPAPEIRIGALEGDPEYLFSEITGVMALSDSRILVADNETGELRYYDHDGRFLERWGGLGEGPGEFRWIRLLQRARGDSLALYDLGARRFTIYSPADNGFRTFSSARMGVGGAWGVSGTRVLVLGAGGSLPPRDTVGLVERSLNVRVFDVARQTIDTVSKTPYFMVATPPDAPGYLPALVLAPYNYRPAVTANADGFWVTTPAEPSVLEYSWEGTLRRIVRLLEPPNEITREEFTATIERLTDSLEPVARRAYDGLEPPATEPTYNALVVDDDGWLWARTYAPSSASLSWLVFDDAGRAVGSVEMPAGLEVQSISHDYVAGVWRDELDVEYARLHRIRGRQ